MRHNWWQVGFFVICLSLAAMVRTYRLDAPLADWHSWRQADTAAVARNYAKEGINLLYPQSDSFLALNEAGLENPDRLFINEFPLYNALVAVIYQQLGVNHVYGRIVSLVMSTLGLFYLLLLTNRLFPFKVTVVTGLFYALSPYNVFYGRVFMPDPSFVALSIMALYYCLRYVDSGKLSHGVAMSLALALAMLVKPYAIFMGIPIFYWLLSNWGWAKTWRTKSHYALAALAFAPLIAWRLHHYLHPEGSFASAWLLNGGDIRFKGSFFRWIIFDRFNRLIFATGGFALFVVGLFRSYLTKKGLLIFVWLASVLLYITVFAKGNVNHDYYQLPIVPVGSILIGLGFWQLVESSSKKSARTFSFILASLLMIVAFAFGWFEVRGFFNINNPVIVEAGHRVESLTPPDARVVAVYGGDPAFLYQTNRHGWPIGGDIDKYIREGATHYATTSFDDEYSRLVARYTLIEKTDQYAIIKLSEP